MKKVYEFGKKFDKHEGTKVMEVKLGKSFTDPNNYAFHSIRYDFIPASIDTNVMATMDVKESGEIHVNFPTNIVFQGSSKPCKNKCVLIVNHDTGEFTLERLSDNFSVKRQRNRSLKEDKYGCFSKNTNDKSVKPKKQSSSENSSFHSNKSKSVCKPNSETQNLAATLGSLAPKLCDEPHQSTNYQYGIGSMASAILPKEELSDNISVKRRRNKIKKDEHGCFSKNAIDRSVKAKKQSFSKNSSSHTNDSKSVSKTNSKTQSLAATLGSLAAKDCKEFHKSTNYQFGIQWSSVNLLKEEISLSSDSDSN